MNSSSNRRISSAPIETQPNEVNGGAVANIVFGPVGFIKLEDQLMYFVALATDYDGTIAEDSVVGDTALEALHELKQSGRKLLLVTGRQLPDLKNVLPEIALLRPDRRREW